MAVEQPSGSSALHILAFIKQKHLTIPVNFLLLSIRPFAVGIESLSYSFEPMLRPLLLVLGQDRYDKFIEFLFIKDEIGERKLNLESFDLILKELQN